MNMKNKIKNNIFMKRSIRILSILMFGIILSIIYGNAQVLFFVDKITFDKIVEHRDPKGMLVERHARAPYLSMDCRIVNTEKILKKLVLDFDHNKIDSLPEMQYYFLWNKKRMKNFDLALSAFPYELAKKRTIILQPEDTLRFTLRSSYLFVGLYNNIFPLAFQTDRKITFYQLLQLIPTLQIEYINKYAKEGEIRELKAKISPIDKLVLEKEQGIE